MNKHFIIGRLGKDPKFNTTKGGTAVCSFSVATSDYFGGEKITNWHNVTAFKQKAELINQHFRKGSQIACFGSMHNESWTDDSGQTRYSYKMILDDFDFVGDRQESGQQTSNEDQHTDELLEDDLPF